MLEEEEANRTGRKQDSDPYSPWIERYISGKSKRKELTLMQVKKMTEFRGKKFEWQTRDEVMHLEASRLIPGRLKRVAWPPFGKPSDEIPEKSPEPTSNQVPVQNSFEAVNQENQGGRNWEESQQAHQTQGQRPEEEYYQHPVSLELPKATVTLLSEPPISQESAPVYYSQPATTSVQGGGRMRGDQKWPPESVKQQSAAENAARIALAKGPACRPRKVKRDYTDFFAQHALNPTYTGYRAPPGTQHYVEEGTSNL